MEISKCILVLFFFYKNIQKLDYSDSRLISLFQINILTFYCYQFAISNTYGQGKLFWISFLNSISISWNPWLFVFSICVVSNIPACQSALKAGRYHMTYKLPVVCLCHNSTTRNLALRCDSLGSEVALGLMGDWKMQNQDWGWVVQPVPHQCCQHHYIVLQEVMSSRGNNYIVHTYPKCLTLFFSCDFTFLLVLLLCYEIFSLDLNQIIFL